MAQSSQRVEPPQNPGRFKLILTHYDEIFTGAKTDLDVLTKRIALLLKHDWERVKWECSPIYVKVFTRFTKKQRAWREPHYRAI